MKTAIAPAVGGTPRAACAHRLPVRCSTRVMAEVTRRVQQARTAAWDASNGKMLQPVNPLHILLAEDDECTRLVVKQLLKRSGYTGDTFDPLERFTGL